MEFTGKIKGITNDFITGELNIIFTVNEKGTILPEYEKIKDCEKLRIEAKKYRNKRSLDSNAYLWILLQKIAESLRSDKWTIYLRMLKQYGQFTYIVVKPEVVEAVKAQWRECEVIGNINVNGKDAVQILCYFGSSTYDTEQMGILIDGVISEAKELGIETITPDELRQLKER